MLEKQAAFSYLSSGYKKRYLSPWATTTTTSERPPTVQSATSQQHVSFLLAEGDVSTAVTTGTTTTNPAAPTTTFEPVLNVPALGTFVLIMSLASFLWLRGRAIGDAAEIRIAALEELRQVKSKELNNEVTSEEVTMAVTAYETALQKEENLRTLLPGVRLRAPNNPVNSERDQQAARQFLNNSDIILPPPTPESSRLSPVAIGALLTFLFTSQILLFAFLSMDDNTATQVLNSIAESTSGDPAAAALLEPATPETTVAETIGNIVGME